MIRVKGMILDFSTRRVRFFFSSTLKNLYWKEGDEVPPSFARSSLFASISRCLFFLFYVWGRKGWKGTNCVSVCLFVVVVCMWARLPGAKSPLHLECGLTFFLLPEQ